MHGHLNEERSIVAVEWTDLVNETDPEPVAKVYVLKGRVFINKW